MNAADVVNISWEARYFPPAVLRIPASNQVALFYLISTRPQTVVKVLHFFLAFRPLVRLTRYFSLWLRIVFVLV